ncbi:MAG: aminotransferase class I/II-fold pyridoxal phosphate-dependent enzyme [Acidimicrobiia bacterium]|nr:aminotransferase class I/II-fold pyridoxal phosphate-dependent enzyme [Acidimicrobiia bacterium]
MVVPVPYYFDHIMAMEALGITPVLVPIGEGHAGIPDAADIAALLGPRTRAILLVTPNNPTGAVIPSTVIDEIAELSHRHSIALIVDETYADLLSGGSAPHSLFSRSDWGELLIHIYSFSKVFGMTGYRVGALAAGQRVREAALKLHDTMMICAPHPAQLAALYGLERLGDWAAANRAEIYLRQSTFASALAAAGSPFRLEAAGGYFAWLRHPYPDRTDFDVARALFEEQHLLTLPGTVFGPGQEAYLRLAVANVDATDLEEVAQRLAAQGVESR